MIAPIRLSTASTDAAPGIDAAPSLLAQQAALGRWIGFGAIQFRIADSLLGEIANASGEAERAALQVTAHFQDLALRSQAQSARVGELSSLATSVEVAGREAPIAEITADLKGKLGELVDKIVALSGKATSTVQALDSVGRSMQEVEACIARVDQINRQVRMLAMNARIEASRAGEAGRAFIVVADEMRELSGSTQKLAETMRAHIGAVIGGVRESHGALRDVASFDVSAELEIRQDIEHIIHGLAERGSAFGRIASEAAADADEIARKIGAAVTGLQFQDRLAQRLSQVSDTLTLLRDSIAERRQETAHLVDETDIMEESEAAWLASIVDRYRLGDMRARFISRVIEGKAAEPLPPPEAGGEDDIEFF